MVYTIAAYHDLGLKFGRDNHETNSKKYITIRWKSEKMVF